MQDLNPFMSSRNALLRDSHGAWLFEIVLGYGAAYAASLPDIDLAGLHRGPTPSPAGDAAASFSLVVAALLLAVATLLAGCVSGCALALGALFRYS